MKKIGRAAIIAVVVVSAAVLLMQKKPVPNGMAPEPKATLAMTNAEISAAISYGKNHKGDLLVDFEKPWTVSLGYGSGKGSATVFTPYHCLALMARTSVLDNSNLDTQVLCRLCAENHKDLYLELILYGDEDGFDRDYKAALLQDGLETPILKTFHQGYDMAREYTISSQQKLYLPAGILKKQDKIILRIVKPKEPELDFVFDLKKIP